MPINGRKTPYKNPANDLAALMLRDLLFSGSRLSKQCFLWWFIAVVPVFADLQT
jgi:hypothetical protein